MTERAHFKNICICGVVMVECRCADPNKTVYTVAPCIHRASETTVVATTLTFTRDELAAVHAAIGTSIKIFAADLDASVPGEYSMLMRVFERITVARFHNLDVGAES